jgi:hypothetical protein
MPAHVWAQVLEVGFDARIALTTGDPVSWHFSGKTPFQIFEPALHQLNFGPFAPQQLLIILG